jgi:hypothetical protein
VFMVYSYAVLSIYYFDWITRPSYFWPLFYFVSGTLRLVRFGFKGAFFSSIYGSCCDIKLLPCFTLLFFFTILKLFVSSLWKVSNVFAVLFFRVELDFFSLKDSSFLVGF